MATQSCTNMHSTQTQGPGLCCSQIASGALAPTIGASVQVTTATGKCGTCSVVPSRSKKHAGKPRLQFHFGGPLCPSTSRGCCALGAAGGV